MLSSSSAPFSSFTLLPSQEKNSLVFLLSLYLRLHSPMHLLLSQLSLMDIIPISVTVPKMLINIFSGTSDISYIVTQVSFPFALAGTECILLTLMFCDQHVAICNHWSYVIVINSKVCLQMAIVSGVGGAIATIVNTISIMNIARCGSRAVHHFFCKLHTILKLSCEDISSYISNSVSDVNFNSLYTPWSHCHLPHSHFT